MKTGIDLVLSYLNKWFWILIFMNVNYIHWKQVHFIISIWISYKKLIIRLKIKKKNYRGWFTRKIKKLMIMTKNLKKKNHECGPRERLSGWSGLNLSNLGLVLFGSTLLIYYLCILDFITLIEYIYIYIYSSCMHVVILIVGISNLLGKKN